MKEGWEYKTLGEVGLFISGYTTWEEFLKEHPVKEVVDMPSLPNGYVARVVTVNAVS